MIATATLETCECGRKFIRGSYSQKRCFICEMVQPHCRSIMARYVGEEPKMEACDIEEVEK